MEWYTPQKSRKLQDTQTNVSLTFAAPGPGSKAILTHMVVQSDAAADISIQSPLGTTIWKTHINALGGYSDLWPWGTGPSGAENQDLVIVVSAGNYIISAAGYVTP